MSYQLGTTSVGSLTYQYDTAGRRIQVGGSLAATNFPAAVGSTAYDAANELTSWSGTTISYDANGNIQNDGIATYSWNGRNQLTGRASTSFQYDAFGRRTLNASGSSLLYEGADTAQELSGTTPFANRVLGGVDEFFSRTDSSGASSPITDASGSTLALTNSTGNVTTQYGYDPFGNTASYGSISGNTFQYTGRENDSNGLYFYRARYYNPTLHRFISPDPLGFSGLSPNLYEYTFDSPTNFVDPSGLDCPENPTDCVLSPGARNDIERSNAAFGIGLNPPSVPSPAGRMCGCGSTPLNWNGDDVYGQVEGLAAMSRVFDATATTMVGVALGVGGVAGGAAFCVATAVETLGLGCVAAGEAGGAAVIGGYFLTRGGIEEIEDMYNGYKSILDVHENGRAFFKMASCGSSIFLRDGPFSRRDSPLVIRGAAVKSASSCCRASRGPVGDVCPYVLGSSTI